MNKIKEDKKIINLTFLGIILTIIFIIILTYKMSHDIWGRGRLDYVDSAKLTTELYIKECLKQNIILAKEIFRYSSPDTEELLKNNILTCLNDFADLRKLGYDIKPSKSPNLNFEIKEDSLKLDFEYPLELELSGKKITLDRFTISIESTMTILSNEGLINSGSIIKSADNSAVLHFENGAIITDEKSNLVDQAKIAIINNNFLGIDDNIAIGVYLFDENKNILFDESVKLKVKIPKNDIINFEDNKQLKIAYFDKLSGIWKKYDTFSYQDIFGNYIFKANINKI